MTGRERIKQLWRRFRASLQRHPSGVFIDGEAGEIRGFFVLGAGRSGTSLLTAMLRTEGLHQGSVHSIQPRAANPMGFYEDWEINALNDQILEAAVQTKRPTALAAHGHGPADTSIDQPGGAQHWLLRWPLDQALSATASQQRDMARLMRPAPFCFKDPRFSYTLDLWIEALPAAHREKLRSICVFRRPEAVVESLLRELRTEPKLHNVAVSVQGAFSIWWHHYAWILKRLAGQRRQHTLMLDYDDLFTAAGQRSLEGFSGRAIRRELPQASLNRSAGNTLQRPSDCHELYQQLRAEARADISRWGMEEEA